MGELTWHVPQRDSRKHLTYPRPEYTSSNRRKCGGRQLSHALGMLRQ